MAKTVRSLTDLDPKDFDPNRPTPAKVKAGILPRRPAIVLPSTKVKVPNKATAAAPKAEAELDTPELTSPELDTPELDTPELESIELNISTPFEPEAEPETAATASEEAAIDATPVEENHASVPLAVVAVVADTPEEAQTRDVLIDQLLQFSGEYQHATMRLAYAVLPISTLEEQLYLLKTEWGGSAEMRNRLLDADELISAARRGRLTRERKSLLDMQYREYHILAQKLARLVGNDTVIHGLQHTVYHEQLHNLIESTAVIMSAVRAMGDMIAYGLPPEEQGVVDDLSPQNLTELVNVCLTVGTSAKSWLMAADSSGKRIKALESQLMTAQESLRATTQAFAGYRETTQRQAEELRKLEHRNFGAKYCLVDPSGRFLSLDPDAKAVNPRVLSLEENMELALMLRNTAKVEQVMDALRRWAKPNSKYRKMMVRKDIDPRSLTAVRVTLTRVKS